MPFLPPVSPAARQTVKAAFDQLDGVILPEDSMDFPTTSLEDVKKAVLTIEDQLATRKSLRNMRRLLPLFAGLEHYAKVVEILCNGTPFLPWIWAPITLILRIASEYPEAFDKLIRGYSQIAECLERFKILNSALSTSQDFQQTLAVFYADILKFHEHAYTFVRRKSWKLFFLTSWGRFERRFNNILDDMKRHQHLVDLQANAHGISDIRQVREEINSWREESKENMLKWHETQSNKQYNSILAWLKADEMQQLAILESIASEGAKFTGACSWVMDHAKTKSWLQKGPESSVLWLQGSAGSGKSVLASQIIGSMKAESRGLIYHFCSQRYASSTKYEQIIRSILLQLLRKDDELIAHVYEACVLGKKAPTLHGLEKLLYNLFAITSRGPRQSEYVWIIIDGLNECEARSQGSVINFINQVTRRLSRTGDRACKVLLCSRWDTVIANRLRTKQIISLTEEKSSVKLAIKQYVSQRLRITPMQEKLAQLEITRRDIDNIERLITTKSDGMFLYARLVLDFLSRNIYVDEKEMMDAIDELPEELSEFYRKILVQILVQLDERSVKRIEWVFSWVAYAKRPLKRMELLSALTFSFGDSKPSKLVPRYVLEICGALVEERSDTSFTFIHVSVKEFLQSSSSALNISEAEAVTKHCSSILVYLNYSMGVFLDNETGHDNAIDKDSNERELHVIKGIHGFHVYATDFWTEYLLRHFELHPAGDSSMVLEPALSLASKLHKLRGSPRPESTLLCPPADTRIKSLEEWPLLERCVSESLQARSLKQLQSCLSDELQPSIDELDQTTPTSGVNSEDENISSETPRGVGDGILSMLSSYQTVIKFLLKQDQYPGVSAEDLDLFKSQFGNSAFTCRLGFCPRATAGFESEELRQQHEIGHTQLLLCTVPDCKYPPLTSIRALRDHTNRYHGQAPMSRPSKRLGQPFFPRMKSSLSGELVWNGSNRETSPNSLMKSSGDEIVNETAEKRPDMENPLISGKMVLREGNGLNSPDNIRSSHSSNPNNASQSPDRQREEIDLPGKKFNFEIDAMVTRRCDVFGCGWEMELVGDIKAGGDKETASHHLEISHLNFGWSKDIRSLLCPVCHRSISDRDGLLDHYTRMHTELLCLRCYVSLGESVTEGELRQHWISTHLKLVDMWVCEYFSVSILGNTCQGERMFDTLEAALDHVASEHCNNETRPSLDLIDCVQNVRWYQVIDQWEEVDNIRQIVYKGVAGGPLERFECENENRGTKACDNLDDMFYVKELAVRRAFD